MRVERIEELSTERLFTHIGEFVDCKKCYSISIKAIFTKDQKGSWSYLMSKCFVGREMHESEDIYIGYAFVTKNFSDMCLTDFITSLEKGGIELSKNLPVIKKTKEHKTYWVEELVPSHATISNYPKREFSLQLSDRNEFSNNKLIGYKKAFYSSAQEYVSQFLGIDIFHGSSDARKGYITISIEDTRCKISEENGHISFESKIENCCLVGQIDNEIKINLEDGEKAPFSSNNSPDLEIWLINEQAQILDYCSNSDYQYKYSHIAEDDSSMLSIIESGEGYKTEFKAYIDVTENKNGKAQEIEKTVCAFSNAEGGYLFIGVSDDGCIEGVDEKVTKHYEKGLDTAMNSYIKDLRKRLTEALSESKCFEIRSIKIGLKHVVAINVDRSQKLNYYVNTMQAHIRRGATSAKMVSTEGRRSDSNTLPLSEIIF